MGRRTKLLKPHSWGAADMGLFSASASVSLSPGAGISPPISCSLFCLPASVSPLQRRPVSLLYSLSSPSRFSLLFPVILLLFLSLSEKPAGCLGPNLTTQREFV